MALVLVVDDEPSVRETFALFLRDEGHHVETAEDAQVALEQLDGLSFDVVVSDIVLPRRSGVSLLEEISDRWPMVKTILVTGEPTVETAARAVRAGAYDYLSKPVPPRALRNIVNKAARVKALEDENRRLEFENQKHRAELARLLQVRTAQVLDTTQALEATEARIRRIAANVPGVLYQFILRPDGRMEIPFISENSVETFGLDPDDVTHDASVLINQLHADDRAYFQESVLRSAATLDPWVWEGRGVLPTGETRWFRANSRPIKQPDGSVEWDGLISDITEHKELQAQVMLTDRMASIGMLAAGVAHEINNPMTYVLANLELLTTELGKPILPDQLPELLEVAREASQGAIRVRAIVQDLKTFSRAKNDPTTAIDVRKVLNSSIRMAQNEIRYRARLIRNFADVPDVEANPSKLGQVFLNLLVNAAQAMPDGKVSRNTISISTRTDKNGMVMVDVADTGCGIDPDVLNNIFDPFFTTKPIGVGTGLGLYICSNIVLAMDGELSVKTELGAGTTFTVALPASAESQQSVVLPDIATPESTGKAAQVLVVDDEQGIIRLLKRALRRHNVSSANNGQTAIEAIADTHFDLIFCDLIMPELTGMEFYEHTRRRRPGQEQRIVFMTGGAFTMQARDFLERVPNRRLEKPFDLKEIRQLVELMTAG